MSNASTDTHAARIDGIKARDDLAMHIVALCLSTAVLAGSFAVFVASLQLALQDIAKGGEVPWVCTAMGLLAAFSIRHFAQQIARKLISV